MVSSVFNDDNHVQAWKIIFCKLSVIYIHDMLTARDMWSAFCSLEYDKKVNRAVYPLILFDDNTKHNTFSKTLRLNWYFEKYGAV